MNDSLTVVLAGLASKLGTTSGHLWQVLVASQAASLHMQLSIWFWIAIGFTVIFISGIVWAIFDDTRDEAFALVFIGLIPAIFTWIGFAVTSYSYWYAVHFPELSALHELRSMLSR